MDKKKKIKYYLALIGIFTAIGFTFLYGFFWNDLVIALNAMEGAWLNVLTSIIRIIILVIMSSILFAKWFKQDKIYTSDAYFLFALFFLIYVVGKIYDLFNNIMIVSGTATTEFILIMTKMRHVIITLNIMPVLYIGLETVKAFISAYIKNINKSRFNKIRLSIVGTYLGIVWFVIILAPTLNALIRALPFYALAIYVIIAVMFFFMYKNRRLSQAHGLIIGIAFLCYIATGLIRSFISVIALENPSIFVVAEILDTVVNFVIFLGFITKPKYAKI